MGQLYESPFNSLAPSGPEGLFPEDRLAVLDGSLRQLTEATRVG